MLTRGYTMLTSETAQVAAVAGSCLIRGHQFLDGSKPNWERTDP